MQMEDITKNVVKRKCLIQIFVNNKSVKVKPGITVAGALLELGWWPQDQVVCEGEKPYGFFCGMGSCYECLIKVDGQPRVQACRTLVREGMHIQLREGTQ